MKPYVTIKTLYLGHITFCSPYEFIEYMIKLDEQSEGCFADFLSLDDNYAKLKATIVQAIVAAPDALTLLINYLMRYGGRPFERTIIDVIANDLKPEHVTSPVVNGIIQECNVVPHIFSRFASWLTLYGSPKLVDKLIQVIPTTDNFKKYVDKAFNNRLGREHYNYQSFYYGYLSGLIGNKSVPMSVVQRDVVNLLSAMVNLKRIPLHLRSNFNLKVRELTQAKLSDSDRLWLTLTAFRNFIVTYREINGLISNQYAAGNDYINVVVDLISDFVTTLLKRGTTIVPSKSLIIKNLTINSIIGLITTDDQLFNLITGINSVTPFSYGELTKISSYLAAERNVLNHNQTMLQFINDYDKYLPAASDIRHRPLTKRELDSMAMLLTLKELT